MKFVFRIPNKILAFFRYVTNNCAAYLCTYTQTCGFYIAYIYTITVYGLVCTGGFVKGKLTDSELDFVLLVSPSSGKFCLHV